MAKWQKKKIQETEGSGFGKYKEGVGGGGSPEKGDPAKHGHGVNSDYRQANNDTMQARTADGKFTYKSVNGQSIDPKYGPSRGKTVNPLLTGGKNGVMISDVEQEFSAQSGAIWDKYKDKWYQKGSEYVLLSQGKGHKNEWTTRVAAKPIWEAAKARYDKVKGEFKGESKLFEESKKGRSGIEEQTAKQLAQSTGEEQAVIDQGTGAIKVKPGTVQNFPSKPSAQPIPAQGAGTGGEAKKPEVTNTVGQMLHTKAQLDTARQILADNGVDTSGYTDEQLDQVVDQYIDFSEDEEETEKVENKIEEKEDSDAVKTIKKMGFSDEKEEKK